MFQKRTIETGKKQPLIPVLYGGLSNLPRIMLQVEITWNLKTNEHHRKEALVFRCLGMTDSDRKLASCKNMSVFNENLVTETNLLK